MATPRREARTQSQIERRIQRLAETRARRAPSLLVTVFGDAIAPHGGVVWIGSLIRLLEPLGPGSRVTRTAMQRLASGGWLTAKPVGRRSNYALSETGRRWVADAERRIYAGTPPGWDGRFWLLLLAPAGLSAERRDRVRRELAWHGFGELSPQVLVHPTPALPELRHALEDLGLARRTVLLRAAEEELFGRSAEERRRIRHRWVSSAWDLAELAAAYRGFLARYEGFVAAVERTCPAPAWSFALRTLLIHDWRRVLLRDPELPTELLPNDWPGSRARGLCRALYQRIEEPARRHLQAVLETAEGPLPEPDPAYFRRFGGLALRPPGRRAPRA